MILYSEINVAAFAIIKTMRFFFYDDVILTKVLKYCIYEQLYRLIELGF